jgi:hypothetical protein
MAKCMKKYGIIYCGFNTEDYILKSIEPFLNRENYFVSAVSVPFKEYKDIDELEDNSTNILRELVNQGRLQYLVDEPKYILELEARNLALENLVKHNVDYIWLVDSDEFYTEKDIQKIEDYVESSNKNLFKISLKNHVFDKEHYIEEPFQPPRIFKCKIDIANSLYPFILNQFYWDNDICYSCFGNLVRYDKIEELTIIPEEIAFVSHFTWLNDKIGKRKVAYQHKHFGHCGYRWNKDSETLEFDEDFHRINNIPIPKIKKI